jgi:hypothetical protein
MSGWVGLGLAWVLVSLVVSLMFSGVLRGVASEAGVEPVDVTDPRTPSSGVVTAPASAAPVPAA